VASHNYFTLFSYHTRSHSMLNYLCPWSGSSLNHDQALMWNLSRCHGGNVVLSHKPCFMPSISQCFYNTFLPTLIWNNNQGWMWNNNPWHQMHLKPSPWLIVIQLDMVNAFNLVLKKTILLKLCIVGWDIIQHIPFEWWICVTCSWISFVL
jgi:hypothetical protein